LRAAAVRLEIFDAALSTPASASGTVIGPTGELFVGQYVANAPILRYLAALTTLTPNGAITGVGLNYPEMMTFVDEELWVASTAYEVCTTETESLIRIAFDGDGGASAAGTFSTGLVGANRGMLWAPDTRSLYVTQCEPVNTIQHYAVAADHTVTQLAATTADMLNNPHGMVITPWGELFVANAGTPANAGNAILRFTLDAQGNPTPNGQITGGDLDLPVNIEFAPWGELFVVNNGNATISRFTFDGSHAATPSRSPFQLTAPTTSGSVGVGFLTLAPGASTPPVAADASADDGGLEE